jgi:hypothetical protein
MKPWSFVYKILERAAEETAGTYAAVWSSATNSMIMDLARY